MKKLIYFFTLIGACLVISSCVQSESLEEVSISREKKDYSQREEKTYQLLNRIYKEAYNGYDVDFEKFNGIIIETFNLTQDDLYALYDNLSRSEHLNEEDFLPTEIQPLCRQLKEYAQDKDLSEWEIQNLLMQSKTLSKENQELFESIIEAINSTISALDRINGEQSPTRGFRDRTWKQNLAAFACAASTSGIAGVYGSAAGTIAAGAYAATGLVSGGIGFGVGLIVGSVLSMLCC